MNAVLLFALAQPAAATPPSHHHEGSLVSGRAQASIALEEHGPTSMLGAGVSLERHIAPHLAMEFTVAKTVGTKLEEVPLEVVLAATWRTGRVEPYLGIGPLLLVVSDHGAKHTRAQPGAVGVLGAHLWLAETWGLLVETGGTVTHHQRAWRPAVDALAGVVVRWR